MGGGDNSFLFIVYFNYLLLHKLKTSFYGSKTNQVSRIWTSGTNKKKKRLMKKIILELIKLILVFS